MRKSQAARATKREEAPGRGQDRDRTPDGRFVTGNVAGRASRNSPARSHGLSKATRLLREARENLEIISDGGRGLRGWASLHVEELGGWDSLTEELKQRVATAVTWHPQVEELRVWELSNRAMNHRTKRPFPWVLEIKRHILSFHNFVRRSKELARKTDGVHPEQSLEDLMREPDQTG